MSTEQLNRMRSGNGFIAALDQSGGSTPKALSRYGIEKDRYTTDEEMFDLIHEMRTRIITSPAFTSEHILGAILFKQTMDRTIDGRFSAAYLWEEKGIIPFLKVDVGLLEMTDGVQLMKPIPDMEGLLKQAIEKNMFGTKMRSVIKEANPAGIKKIAQQQFEIGKQIAKMGLVPILEPEIDINSTSKEESEALLKEEILKQLAALDDDVKLMFKLTIPTEDDFYRALTDDPHVLRVVALSGGYSQKEAAEKLAQNHGLIASFSRALTEGLTADQTDEEFNETLAHSIQVIYDASLT